jgi:lipopolysaccharide export LptBFGC system permease protein LptF
MRVALLLAVANVGWITPAANNAYRSLIVGGAAFRGANELTLIELGRRVYEASPRDAGDPLPLAFYLNARLAIALAPVLLSVLALAGATATRRGLSAAIVVVTLTVFVGCCVLFSADDIAVLTRWLPGAAIAWLPNALVMIATLPLAANQRSG